MTNKNSHNYFNTFTQILLPLLTITGNLVVAIGSPKWGMTILLMGQPFWIYSAWKAYKKAGQIGMLLTTVLLTIIVMIGVFNYWFIKI